MSRGQGFVYKPINGKGNQSAVFWLDYTVDGRRYRESSKTKIKKEAMDLLDERRAARKSRKMVGRPDKVTLGELKALAEKSYDLGGLRSKDRMLQCWKHVEAFFGADVRVIEIDGIRLDDYAARRLKQGAARQTVNNELSMLRRGFKLGVEKSLLAVMPTFDLPKVNNTRSGFFEEDDFAALMAELPPDVGDLVAFLRSTGWRRDEGRLLQWAAVDMEGGTIRLEEARSKSGRGRVFPFGLAPSLKTLIDKHLAARDGLYVFHRDGQPLGIGAIRSAWRRATKRAGLAGRLVHDLRRSAARDFRRAGVSEGEVMKLCGWETRSMFDRYNVIDEQDLARAVAKRFANDKLPASSEASKDQ